MLNADPAEAWRCRRCQQYFPPSEFAGQEEQRSVVCRKCQEKKQKRTKSALRECPVCKKSFPSQEYGKYGRAYLQVCRDCCNKYFVYTPRAVAELLRTQKRS